MHWKTKERAKTAALVGAIICCLVFWGGALMLLFAAMKPLH